MKKITSALVIMFILCSLIVPFNAGAAAPSGTYGTDYIKYGDVDINQQVDVIDALYTLKQSVNSSTLTTQKKGPADVDQNAGIDSVDALQILQFAVETRSAFTEEYIIDKIGGGTNFASCDGIPDKYQKKVTFAISNGKWSDNTTANKIQYKTLTASGKYSASGSSSLSAPTGMQRNYGYNNGAWNTTVPTSVSGTADVTYTYSFARMSVNYTVQHFRTTTTGGSYSTTPTETETKSGYVNDTVTATAKTYAGYSLDSSRSTTGVQLKEEASNNVLKMYYGVASSNYITNYSKANVNNGAYTKDTTSDTSYSVNINSLKPYTFYHITTAAVTNGLTNNYDYKRLVYCLQGLINRDFGMDAKHTDIVYTNTYSSSAYDSTSDTAWRDYIRTSNSILKTSSASAVGDGLTQVDITTWSDLYANFKDVIKSCGIVLWDRNVPATANVAVTICGVTGYLPVLSGSALHTALVNDGVPVKLSLVGLFSDGKKGTAISGCATLSTGSAKNDAYIWAIEKYFNRCSSKYLAYVVDGGATLKGYSGYTDNATSRNCRYDSLNGMYNYDYFVARRCFCFDLSPYGGEAACDDPAQKNGQASTGADPATMKFLFQRRYERASGEIGQLIGFPPWWCKYCSNVGLGSQTAFYIEWLFTEVATCYNLAMEADAAGEASMTNASVYYKYVPKYSTYTNSTTTQNLAFDSNTFYYTIYMGDYDSAAWLKVTMQSLMTDSKHGTLPLMWGFNPNLSYRIPMAFDYFQEKRNNNDYLVGGSGGAGYIIHEALYQDKTLAYMGEKRPMAAGGTAFANYSKTFYQRFKMDSTGFIINGAQNILSENIVKNIATYSPKLNFTNCDQSLLVRYNNTYFVFCHNQIQKDQYDTMYSYGSGLLSAKYNFGAFRTVLLSPTDISTIVSGFQSYASAKGMSVKYIDPCTYYKLLNSSGQGRPVGASSTLLESCDSVNSFTPDMQTTLAIEPNNKVQGGGALWMGFGDPTGTTNGGNIGGMVRYRFSTGVNLSEYKYITLDYWTSYTVSGSAAIQVNFVTNGSDDGFNYTIGIDNAIPGWHTLILPTSSPNVTTNGANWNSIKAIRITYINYDKLSKPDFLMLDNIVGVKS